MPQGAEGRQNLNGGICYGAHRLRVLVINVIVNFLCICILWRKNRSIPEIEPSMPYPWM